MAKEKKGAKFGRHARNPSSKLQPQRTERNKRLAVERHVKRMAKKAARRSRWEARQTANVGRPFSEPFSKRAA